MYFNDIEISNFRGFDYLKINGLSKLNVFVGANNVGKTSILESAFMMVGMSNPLMPTRINYWRMLTANGMDSVRYLFHNVDFSSEPTLTAKCGNMVRKMSMRPIMKNESENMVLGSSTLNSIIAELDFSFDDDYKGVYRYHTKLYTGNDGNLQQQIEQGYIEPINCLFLSADKNDANAVSNFAALVKRNRKDVISKAIREFDQSIESVEALPDGLYLKIKDLHELLPISMAGDGVRRLVNILSSIANDDYDIVLIDELDNGLHYSAHKLLWKTILTFVSEKKIQLFVTTHNLDCLQGLKNALAEKENLRNLASVFTIAKTKKEGFQAYRYDYDGLKAAIDNEIEIRR